MIAEKPELTIAKDALWEFSLVYQKGSQISLTEIERVTGIARYTGSWNHVLKSWKERMSRDRGITVFARSAGFAALLTDREVTTDYAEFQQRVSRRRIRRTLKRVRRTDDSRLSLAERRLKLELIGGLKKESAQISAGLNISRGRRTATNPLRKLPA